MTKAKTEVLSSETEAEAFAYPPETETLIGLRNETSRPRPQALSLTDVVNKEL